MSGILLNLERSSLDMPWGFRLQKTSDVFPPSVTRVIKNSLAEICGLKTGDYFVRVKDIDVSHMTCADVMNIIKCSQYRLPVVVVRESQCDNQLPQSAQTSSLQDKYNELSFTSSAFNDDTDCTSFTNDYVAGSRPINGNDSSVHNSNISYSPPSISISQQPIPCRNGARTADNLRAKVIQPGRANNSTLHAPLGLADGKENGSMKVGFVVQGVQTSTCVEERTARDAAVDDDDDDDDRGGNFYTFSNAKKEACDERVAEISGIFPFLDKSHNTVEQNNNHRVVLAENPTNQQQLLHPLLMESLPVHLQQQLMPHLEAVMTNLQHHQQNTPYESYLLNNNNNNNNNSNYINNITNNNSNIDNVSYTTPSYQQNYIAVQSYPDEGLNGYTILPPPPEFMGPFTRPYSPSSTPTPVQSLEGESWLSFDPHSESPSSLSSFKPYMFDLTEQDITQQNLYLYRQYFLEQQQQQQQYREMIERHGNDKLSSPIDSLLSIDSIRPFSIRSSPLELHAIIPPPPVHASSFQCQERTPLILPPPSPFSEPPFLGADQSESFPPPVQFCTYPGDVYSNSDGQHRVIHHPMPSYDNYAMDNGSYVAYQDCPITPAFPGGLRAGDESSDSGFHQSISGLTEQSLPGRFASFYFPQETDFQTFSGIIEPDRNISRTSSTTPMFLSDFHTTNSDDFLREMAPLPFLSGMNFHDTTESKPLCLSEIEITLDSESEMNDNDDDDVVVDSNQISLTISDKATSKNVSIPAQVISEAHFDLEQCSSSSSSTETLNFESKDLASETDCFKNFGNTKPQNNDFSTNTSTTGAPGVIQCTELISSGMSTDNPKEFTFESKWSSDLLADKFSSSVTLTENQSLESFIPAAVQPIDNRQGLPRNNSEQKQNISEISINDNLDSPFQTIIQDAQKLELETPNKPESLPVSQKVTSTLLPNSEPETSFSLKANAPLWQPSSSVPHTCPHCHSSLPRFDAALPYRSSGLGFNSWSDQENQTGNVQPPPAPPLPDDLLTPGEPKLNLTRRRSLQPGDTMLPDRISGLLTTGVPGRTPWSYVPDKKIIEEQSQRIRKSLMKKYSRRASEIDLQTLEREKKNDDGRSCIHSNFESMAKGQVEFNEDIFLKRIKKTSASDEHVEPPKSFQMLRKTFSNSTGSDNPPRPQNIRRSSETPWSEDERPMERIIYSGKKIPSRTFNRLETTMARKAQAEEMKKKRCGLTAVP